MLSAQGELPGEITSVSKVEEMGEKDNARKIFWPSWSLRNVVSMQGGCTLRNSFPEHLECHQNAFLPARGPTGLPSLPMPGSANPLVPYLQPHWPPGCTPQALDLLRPQPGRLFPQASPCLLPTQPRAILSPCIEIRLHHFLIILQLLNHTYCYLFT